MNNWVIEVKDFEEEILEGLYTLLNENGISKVKDLINLKNKQIQELTNNWNELEEWLQNEYNEWSTVDDEIIRAEARQCIEVLDKMKEIKGKNK